MNFPKRMLPGDLVRVLRNLGSMKAGTYWRVTSIFEHDSDGDWRFSVNGLEGEYWMCSDFTHIPKRVNQRRLKGEGVL
jgi:hypothetical protein